MDIKKEILKRYKEEKNFIKSSILTELIADNVDTQDKMDDHANFWQDFRYHKSDLFLLLDNLEDIEEYVNNNNVFPNSDFEDKIGCIIYEFLLLVDDCLRHYVQSLANEFRVIKDIEEAKLYE